MKKLRTLLYQVSDKQARQLLLLKARTKGRAVVARRLAPAGNPVARSRAGFPNTMRVGGGRHGEYAE